MLAITDILRLPIGHLTAAPDHPLAGRKIFVQSFLIRHPDGAFLWDSGIGSDPAIDAELKIIRRSLPDALASAGARIDDVKLVSNCHLHFDHAGENFRFAGVPIFAQRSELAAVNDPHYTLPPLVAEFEGATFEQLDGRAEPLSGLTIIPTPGHTDGHQSLLVDTKQGRVLLAGQAFNFASDYADADYVTRHAPDAEHRPPPWMQEIQELDVRRALFAHDEAIWDRDPLAPL